jgi:hypothetical protein
MKQADAKQSEQSHSHAELPLLRMDCRRLLASLKSSMSPLSLHKETCRLSNLLEHRDLNSCAEAIEARARNGAQRNADAVEILRVAT